METMENLEKNKKSSEIRWWHLLAAGMGLNLLLNNPQSLFAVVISMFGTFLSLFGFIWGIVVGIRYIKNRYSQPKRY